MEKKTIFLIIKITLSIIITITAIILYSRYIATKGLVVKEYLIENDDLPDSFQGLKVVHISDIHYKQTTEEKDLHAIVDRVNEIKPDIIVITGDILDNEIEYTSDDIKALDSMLSNMEASLGKYIITGDNDYKEDIYLAIITNTGFKNLDDAYDVLYNGDNNPILIAGLSTVENDKREIDEKIRDSITKIKELKTDYNILIMHEPDLIEDIDYTYFDLVLAGHSLNGQIRLPLIGAIKKEKYAKKYYDEYYDLDGTDLYVSSGIGTTSFKFRLFNRPSFNLYRIVNE